MAAWWAEAERGKAAITYGPLPDAGFSADDIRLVLHTTETSTVPGYREMKDAPHFTYYAAKHKFIQHAPLNRRVGTMLGHSTTGIRANEISIQVEIVCYSDKRVASKHSSRIWVGDLTDRHYKDLASLVTFIRGNNNLPMDKAYGPKKDFDSFLYGKHDEHEMGHAEWYAFKGGVTAHGAAPHQLHWDTGVLNIHRIVRESLEDEVTPMMIDWKVVWNQTKNDAPPDGVIQWFQEGLIKLGHLGASMSNPGVKNLAVQEAWKAFEASENVASPNIWVGAGTFQRFLDRLNECPPSVGDCSAQDAKLAQIHGISAP